MHRTFAFASARWRSSLPVAHKKETESIKQLSAGEPTAWAQFVEQWSLCLYNYLLYNAVSEAEAPMLMQAIFSEIIQAFAGSPRIPKLATLIFSITYQHVFAYRQQNFDRVFKKPQSSPPSGHGAQAKADKFFHSFQCFSHEVQQILLLHYHYGISVREISQIVGQPEALLSKTLGQAKSLLQ